MIGLVQCFAHRFVTLTLLVKSTCHCFISKWDHIFLNNCQFAVLEKNKTVLEFGSDSAFVTAPIAYSLSSCGNCIRKGWGILAYHSIFCFSCSFLSLSLLSCESYLVFVCDDGDLLISSVHFFICFTLGPLLYFGM